MFAESAEAAASARRVCASCSVTPSKALRWMGKCIESQDLPTQKVESGLDCHFSVFDDALCSVCGTQWAIKMAGLEQLKPVS